MKNNTLLFVILILSLIICYLLLKQPQTINCNDCPKTVCLDPDKAISSYTKSPHKVPLKYVKDLYGNYNDRLKPELEKLQNNDKSIPRDTIYQETKYIWMSYKRLKEYVEFLEAVSAINKQKVSGVAMYFGAYSKNINVKEDNPKLNPPRFGDYRGRLTSFFTPTFYDANATEKYEILKHKPFLVASENPEKSPYVGKFVAVDFDEDNTTQKGAIGASEVLKSNFLMTLTPLTLSAQQGTFANIVNCVPPRH